MMKSFKITFYVSENGELVKAKEFFRFAENLKSLVANPPEEFFEMLESCFPMHGWAEIEQETANVFVIFTPRNINLQEVNKDEFRHWLENLKPSDFSEHI